MVFHPPNKRFSEFYRKFLYRFIGGKVLLLTNTGRKSGKAHTIGLQYELIEGVYFVGAADGEKADWLKNLRKNPAAEIQVGSAVLPVKAEIVLDAEKITDFLVYRVRKHPLMIPLIMRLDGFRGKFTREALLAYSSRLRVVMLSPRSSAPQ